METACLFRSSTFNYVFWHFVPPQNRKRGRVPKYLKFGVLCEVPPVDRSYLSLFSLLTSYNCNLSSIQLYCFLSQPALAIYQ